MKSANCTYQSTEKHIGLTKQALLLNPFPCCNGGDRKPRLEEIEYLHHLITLPPNMNLIAMCRESHLVWSAWASFVTFLAVMVIIWVVNLNRLMVGLWYSLSSQATLQFRLPSLGQPVSSDMEDDSTNNIIVLESECNADCWEQSKLRLEVYEMLATWSMFGWTVLPNGWIIGLISYQCAKCCFPLQLSLP